MAYTSIDDPTILFNTVLYTGTGSSNAITGVGFQPNWVWLKDVDAANGHFLYDSVRGVTKEINSQTSQAEQTKSGGLTTFGSDGFTVGDYSGHNDNTTSYVSWNWKAGTSFSNDASATSVGSIDSAGSVNTDAGFSIIGYTGAGDGTASSAETVAHGLGVAPAVIIVKNRADSTNWYTYHHENTSAPQTDVLYLNLGNATGDDNGPWNDVAPSSSVFTVGGDNGTNGNGDNMIAYCFAEKKGYSKFGSYIGNGNADGPFVYTGFKPAWIIYKRTDGAADWHQYDNKRETFNVVDLTLFPSASNAASSGDALDFLSNGFKQRNTGAEANGSGSTYVYIAFAESPFVSSNKIPNNAR